WDGTSFVRQETYNTIESLQDAKVTVQRSTVCKCETIQAKIIDPNTMLLQNLDTGAYFYADKQSIEYTSIQPDNGGTVLVFQFESNTTEYNGTLSYLMKGITWTPNYDLFLINDNEAKLRAYANIKNNQQQEYKVENTHLLSGDVQLATSYTRFNYISLMGGESVNMQQIQSDGEHKGLYSYSLNDQYTLRSSSSIRLPFIDIVAKYKFYYKAFTSISTAQYQGVFDRSYDLTPDQFMPAGIISIYDNRVLVGQSSLPDIPENYTQTISVGHDNDVRYVVNSNLTSKSNGRFDLIFFNGSSVKPICTIVSTNFQVAPSDDCQQYATICVPTCASHQQCISGVCVGRGSLSFTLTWSRAGDGDIIVTIPNGNTIMYSQRGPNFLTNYGQLDVDDQRGTGPENIYWNSTEPASGTYQVCFQQYSFNTFATPTDPITAVVEVNRAGHDPQTFRKTFTQRMPFPLPNNCQESYDTYLGSIVY
ncbi:unnamed protein product, partial [Rotaria sp. Silwood2]